MGGKKIGAKLTGSNSVHVGALHNESEALVSFMFKKKKKRLRESQDIAQEPLQCGK